MEAFQVVTLIIALIGSALTTAGALWKMSRLIAWLEGRISACEHEQKSLMGEMLHQKELSTMQVNGAAQRVEHINTRTTSLLKESATETANQLKSLNSRLRAVEGFLAKTTAFEERGER